jgi:uncharacterized protein YbjT (DUF2867 family)
MTRHCVAVTGATGLMGRALTVQLLAHGHEVRALIRPGSAARVMQGASIHELDLFVDSDLISAMQGCDSVVHLVGTAHPNPRKAKEFLRVDLASARACAAAAARCGVAHFVYVSVAQPAPVMRAYVAARAEAERVIANSGLTASLLRPWYVLGPGRWWPVALLPVYSLAQLLPATRASAQRLGLVTLAQMVRALVRAVEQPAPAGTQRVIEVPEIRHNS